MNNLFIFGAEYLFVISPLMAAFIIYKLPREAQKEVALFAFFSLPLTFLISVAARELYFNPLPFVVNGFNPLIPHAPDNGFPSDHTLLLSSIAALISFLPEHFDKRYTLALWAITLIVGGSRMFVGVHHLMDVMGAIAIALISAGIVSAVLRYGKRV